MHYLSKSEVETVLRAAWKKSTRDHLLLLFSFSHALRRSEVAALKTGDVSGGLLRVQRVKHSLYTEQPLISSGNALFDETRALQAWMEERPGSNSDALFLSREGGHMTPGQVGRVAVRYMELAGVHEDLCHHHILKHSSCAYLIRTGVGLEHVKQFAGHKSISSTIQYLHISDSEAMAKAQAAFSSNGRD